MAAAAQDQVNDTQVCVDGTKVSATGLVLSTVRVEVHMAKRAKPRGWHGDTSLSRKWVYGYVGLMVAWGKNLPPLRLIFNYITLCGVQSVAMFCFALFCFLFFLNFCWSFHSTCSISPTASGTCKKYKTKYHDWVDAPQCTGWGGHLFRRFCNTFSKSSTCLLEQHGSCSIAQQPGEPEKSKQHLPNKWPPHRYRIIKAQRQSYIEERSAVRVEHVYEVSVGLVHPDRRVHQIDVGSGRLQSCFQYLGLTLYQLRSLIVRADNKSQVRQWLWISWTKTQTLTNLRLPISSV